MSCQVLTKNWLKCKSFTDELDFLKGAAKRQSDLILAKYISVATAKLIGLTGSEKEETARKACLDIISIPQTRSLLSEETEIEKSRSESVISPYLASRLLDLIAQEK
jgi:hypothetical protein